VSPDEAICVAAKLAIDAGDLTRARALLELLDVERQTAPVALHVTQLQGIAGRKQVRST
jgi:hypothetical protein